MLWFSHIANVCHPFVVVYFIYIYQKENLQVLQRCSLAEGGLCSGQGSVSVTNHDLVILLALLVLFFISWLL